MMLENENIPKIRFKGFIEPWKRRKLGDISEIIGGGTPSTEVPEYWNGNINWYSPAEIGSQIYVKKSQRTITELGLEKSSAKILPIGSVLFTSRAGIGSMAILEEKASTNQGFQSIVPIKNQLDSYFIFSRSNELKKYAETVGAGSTFIEVSGKQMKEMEILIPKIDEQSQIGLFFKQLDKIITLHKCKCEKLKQIKKSMLEKMFPHEGKNVPEIRFKEFTEPWERRKLGELCSITTGKLDANAMNSDGKYDFYTSGIDVFKIDVAAFEGPAITIAGNGASVGYMHLADGKFNAYQRTYVLTSFFADRQFLSIAIGNELPDKIQEEVRGSGIPYIVLNMLTDLAIPFPSQEEQAVVGHYFTNLDKLIILHQRKYEKLKQIKKSLLEKMFAQ